MKYLQNENKVDRVIRFLVTVCAGSAAVYSHGTIRDVWMVVAAIALISSLSGFSLFYWLVGIKTLKGQK